jgi:ribonuclease HI
LSGKAKKYYAVARGSKPGIYTTWFGPEGAEIQIRGFAGARYKGFATLEEAQQWLQDPVTLSALHSSGETAASETITPGTIVIFTDGGCRGNPGPGGYCAIIDNGRNRKELFQGYRLTTNNRMELMACIAGLETLETPTEVMLYSDSQYVVNGMTRGWARKWRSQNWMRTKTEAAENADLWSRLLALCDRHRVKFFWVRGHAGHPENERCDELATAAADGSDLAEDQAYSEGRTRSSSDLHD